MSEFLKYQHIERLNTQETEGITDGVYKEAVKKLKANDSIPEMIRERWISKIETGSLG